MNKIKSLWKHIRRGFKHETFSIQKPGPLTECQPYCAFLQLLPGDGVEWKEVILRIGGPVTIAGELTVFSRKVLRETAHRYSFAMNLTVPGPQKSALAIIPIVGDSANIGRLGVYVTLTNGETFNYITPGEIVLQCGSLHQINVPLPDKSAEAPTVKKRKYVKPTVTAMDISELGAIESSNN